MFKKNSTSTLTSSLVSISIICVIIIAQIGQVFAASLSSLSDAQSSIKINTLSDHTIQFVTPTGISAGQAISVTFSAGYATGTFALANFDFGTSTSAVCSGFADALLVSGAASGISWGVSQATNTIYIVSGTAVIPANRCVQIKIGSNAIFQASGTAQIINPTVATTTGATLAIAGFGDNGIITNNIITNDTVAVTATVAQTFTFSISTSTIFFGTLSSINAKFASSTNPLGDTLETVAHTLAASTNAPSGYTITVKGQTLTSLQNATNTINAIGATAASSTFTGTEQFGLRATVTGGTGAVVSSPYSFSSSYGYSATATTSAVLATETNAANTTTYSLRYVANIAPLTEAGTYVANIVYVATANF